MDKIILKTFTDSSVIKIAMWNISTQDMIVVFNSGSVWCYSKIPSYVWQEFIDSKSAGNYFNNMIRGKYDDTCLYKPGVQVV